MLLWCFDSTSFPLIIFRKCIFNKDNNFISCKRFLPNKHTPNTHYEIQPSQNERNMKCVNSPKEKKKNRANIVSCHSFPCCNSLHLKSMQKNIFNSLNKNTKILTHFLAKVHESTSRNLNHSTQTDKKTLNQSITAQKFNHDATVPLSFGLRQPITVGYRATNAKYTNLYTPEMA